MEKFSPSTNPQNMDTISIEYVTDDANTGLEILIRLLKIIFANAVPKIANIKTYNKDSLTSTNFRFSYSKPEK